MEGKKCSLEKQNETNPNVNVPFFMVRYGRHKKPSGLTLLPSCSVHVENTYLVQITILFYYNMRIPKADIGKLTGNT